MNSGSTQASSVLQPRLLLLAAYKNCSYTDRWNNFGPAMAIMVEEHCDFILLHLITSGALEAGSTEDCRRIGMVDNTNLASGMTTSTLY